MKDIEVKQFEFQKKKAMLPQLSQNPAGQQFIEPPPFKS